MSRAAPTPVALSVTLGCAVVAVAVVAVALVYFGAGEPVADQPVRLETGDSWRVPAAPFIVEGDANETITPGIMTALDLVVTNPGLLPLAITDYSVRVRNVDAPNATEESPCSLADFIVKQVPARSPITLAALSQSSLSALGLRRDEWPHVGMLNRPLDQDGCQGATVTLEYAALGRLQE